MKQNELVEEVDRLKSELEAVRQDREYQLAQVQSLTADIAKQKEVARRCGAELENAMRRVAALEVSFLSCFPFLDLQAVEQLTNGYYIIYNRVGRRPVAKGDNQNVADSACFCK